MFFLVKDSIQKQHFFNIKIHFSLTTLVKTELVMLENRIGQIHVRKKGKYKTLLYFTEQVLLNFVESF